MNLILNFGFWCKGGCPWYFSEKLKAEGASPRSSLWSLLIKDKCPNSPHGPDREQQRARGVDIKDRGEGSVPSCVSSVTPASPHPSSKWGQTGGSRALSQSSLPTLPDFHVLIPCSCSHQTPTTCRNGEALQMTDYLLLFSEPFGSWKNCFKNSITHNFSRNLKSKFYLLFLSFQYLRFFRPSSCLPSPAASFLWGPYR